MHISLYIAISKRLKKELKEIEETGSPFITAGPISSDLHHWQAIIIGPPGSPYEDGTFILKIDFPAAYPMRRPRVLFHTYIYHPNIGPSGVIKMNMHWNPSITIINVLFHISYLLDCPNLDHFYIMQDDAAATYRNNKEKYFKLAKKWTEKYAM